MSWLSRIYVLFVGGFLTRLSHIFYILLIIYIYINVNTCVCKIAFPLQTKITKERSEYERKAERDIAVALISLSAPTFRNFRTNTHLLATSVILSLGSGYKYMCVHVCVCMLRDGVYGDFAFSFSFAGCWRVEKCLSACIVMNHTHTHTHVSIFVYCIVNNMWWRRLKALSSLTTMYPHKSTQSCVFKAFYYFYSFLCDRATFLTVGACVAFDSPLVASTCICLANIT